MDEWISLMTDPKTALGVEVKTHQNDEWKTTFQVEKEGKEAVVIARPKSKEVSVLTNISGKLVPTQGPFIFGKGERVLGDVQKAIQAELNR